MRQWHSKCGAFVATWYPERQCYIVRKGHFAWKLYRFRDVQNYL